MPKNDKNKPLGNWEGDPKYSSKDDIFENSKKIDADDNDIPENDRENIEINLEDQELDLDENLDVPGAELDDADELIGEEDEENNYYSLGGENHEDLEEDDEEKNA